MVVKAHSGKDYPKGNKASCSDLVEYLAKENEGVELAKQEFFFNKDGDYYNDLTVIQRIDNNVKGLKKDETKFFMLTVNPSQRELAHLANMACGRKVDDIKDMTPQEFEKYNGYIKEYTNNVMEIYADGFNKGLTASDIVYFSKVEQQRTYTFDDEILSKKVAFLKAEGHNLKTVCSKLANENQRDVKTYFENGTVSKEQKKEGLQTHVHIVVSRKDKTMKTSISPLANSRGKGKEHKLNGKVVGVGFDRDEFKQRCETQFDSDYGYKREAQEYYSYSKGAKQNVSISANQINNFVHNYSSKAKNSAVKEKETGDKEMFKAYNLASSIHAKNPKSFAKGVMSFGDYKLNSGDLGRMNQGEFLKLITSIAKGNPISIAKEALQLLKGTIEHTI